MEIANIHEAKTQLSKLVERALEGEEVIIARAGKPVVRLVPILQSDTPGAQGRPMEGQGPYRRGLRRVARGHRRSLRGSNRNDAVA